MHLATEVKADEVNRPAHYTQGGIECLDAIEAALGRDGFRAFLRGQVIKYVWRAELKHASPLTDARKAQFYLCRYIDSLTS
jgi:hypothetical protein